MTTFYDVSSGGGYGGYTGYVPNGNDIASYTVIQPPDDRYVPGYSIVQVDGDIRTVGPRLKDLNVVFSLYGLPIPISFGVRRLFGNMVWCVPLRESINKKKKNKGQKKTTTYEYFGTFAVSFGEPGNTDVGTTRDVIRMWANGALIYDRRGTGNTSIQGLSFKFYKGTADQEPDPTIEEREGVGNASAMRNLMYVVISDLPLANFGDSPPVISIEIGDVTNQVYSITNIYPDADSGGSRVQDQVLANFDYGQAYTLHGSSDPATLRVYDLTNGTVLNTSNANGGTAGVTGGVGWDNNDGDVAEANLAHLVGADTAVSSIGYIPWLNKIIAQTGGSGHAIVYLMDPISGLASHWIGADTSGTSPAYPVRAVATDDDFPFYQGEIPTPEWFTAQYVTSLYSVDTYIFLHTVYSSVVILKLDGASDLLDMVYKETGTNLHNAVAGFVGDNFSTMYAFDSNNVYQYMIDAGTNRSLSGSTSTITGITKTTVLSTSGIVNIFFHQTDTSLIVFRSNGHVYKYDSDLTLVWDVDITAPMLPPSYSERFKYADTGGATLAWNTNASSVRVLDLDFGEFTEYTYVASKFFVSQGIYDDNTQSLLGVGTSGTGANGTDQTETKLNALGRLFFDRIGDERITLASFLTGMALYAGYTLGQISVDASIDDMIDGALITNVTTFNNIVGPICTIYGIDMIESDGLIKFIRKTVGYSGTDFAIDDGGTLTPNVSDTTSVTFQVRREQEAVIPQRVTLQYLDKNLDYNWSIQMATRSQFIRTNNSQTQATYQVPIIMTASEAKTLATRTLWRSWQSAVSYQFRLGSDFIKIEPGDVGTIVVGGLQYTVKAVQVTYNNDFSVTVAATNFLSDQAVEIVGDSGSGDPQIIPTATGAEMFIFDIPLIQSTDDANFAGQFPVYFQITPLIPITTGWDGGVGYVAHNLTTYDEAGINTTISFVGICSDSLPHDNGDWPLDLLSTDTENTLTVALKSGDPSLLVSCTEDEILNDGANLAAYGANGRWELIQYQTVVDNGDNTYTLSNISRARRGTEYAVNYHRAGDFLIPLSTDFTDALALTFAEVNVTLGYKATGINQSSILAVPNHVAIKGKGCVPWSATNIQIARNKTTLTGDITITWDRRSRTSGQLLDGGEYAPMGSTESDVYAVIIQRWPFYSNWVWNGTFWEPGAINDEEGGINYTVASGTPVVLPNSDPGERQSIFFDVQGPSLTLTAAILRDIQVYEFSAPDDLYDEFSAFSQVPGAYIAESAAKNAEILAMGYDDFMAFKYLRIQVLQKTSVPNSTGYGSQHSAPIIIQDT